MAGHIGGKKATNDLSNQIGCLYSQSENVKNCPFIAQWGGNRRKLRIMSGRENRDRKQLRWGEREKLSHSGQEQSEIDT